MRTQFFYANNKKGINTKQEMKKVDGNNTRNFQEIFDLGMSYFQSLYSSPNRVNIAKIIKNYYFFLRVANEKVNQMLLEEASKEELNPFLSCFK